MVEVDRQIRAKMVKLRKLGAPIASISYETGVNTVYVADILQKELKDDYIKYCLKKPERIFTPEEIRKVVDLRKKHHKIGDISELTDLSHFHITKILKEELGDDHKKYSPNKMHKRYLEGLYDKEIKDILVLNYNGKSLEEIRTELGFSRKFIKKILIEVRGEAKPSSGIEKRSKFEVSYTQFVEEASDYTSNNLEIFKPEALTIFLNVLEKVPQGIRNIDVPVFIYAFLRAKGVTIPFSFLRDLTGKTRHQIYNTLKRLNGTFPGYLNRDRKQVVLDRLREATVYFKLNKTFFENTRKILDALWEIVKITKDRVIACTVATLGHISINCDSSNITEMCRKIGASHSAVGVQIRDKILPYLKINGFTTLAGSKRLITTELLEKVVGLQDLPDYPHGLKRKSIW